MYESSSMVLVALMLCGCGLVAMLPAATDSIDLVLINSRSAASGDDLFIIPVVRLAVVAGEEMW